MKIFGLRDSETDRDERSWAAPPRVFKPLGPSRFGYAPGLIQELRNTKPDILHVHGLWMYISVASLRWADGTKPYVVSPHGMLDPWAVNNSPLTKRIAAALYENRHLRGAACLHALNPSEAHALREYGLRSPISVIPNGVRLPPDVALPMRAPWAGHLPSDARVLLYIGRLHAKKGLDGLMRAWRAVKREAQASGWHLVIAGWDDGGHESHLRSLLTEFDIGKTVHFIGPQFDDAKASSFSNAQAFILPSLSEGLPMTILEAWAYRLPVLMTPKCNLNEGFLAGGAMRIEGDPDSTAEQLTHLFGMPDGDLRVMGARGRALVEAHYQWPAIARKMIDTYQWALGAGAAPAHLVV